MLFVPLLVALVVDAAVVPNETPEYVIYTATFTSKLGANGQVEIDNHDEHRMDQRRPGQQPKERQQFNIDQTTSQKLPAQLSAEQNTRRQDERTKNVNIQQDYKIVGETTEAWRNAQDQETGLQVGGVNGRGLYGDQGVKDVASASPGLSRIKSTKKIADTTSIPSDGFKMYFGSKKDQSATNLHRDEAINSHGSQPQMTRTESENIQSTENIQRFDYVSGKIQIFDYTSGNNAGFGVSKTINQNSESSDSNSRLSANPADRTESVNKQRTSAETGGNQRFDYTKQGNIDRYDTRKIIADDNRMTGSKILGANAEDTGSGNRRTDDNLGTHDNNNVRTGTKVEGNEEDNDGIIYFQPDLERRKMKNRPKIVTTTPPVTLDNRNAFDVNVTCGPGMQKISGGSCAPTE